MDALSLAFQVLQTIGGTPAYGSSLTKARCARNQAIVFARTHTPHQQPLTGLLRGIPQAEALQNKGKMVQALMRRKDNEMTGKG